MHTYISWQKVVRSREATGRVLQVTAKPFFGGFGGGVKWQVDGLWEKLGHRGMECLRGAEGSLFLMAQPACPETLENHTLFGKIGLLQEDGEEWALHGDGTRMEWKDRGKSRDWLTWFWMNPHPGNVIYLIFQMISGLYIVSTHISLSIASCILHNIKHAVSCVWVCFIFTYLCVWDFQGGARGKEHDCQCRWHERGRFSPWVGRSPGGGCVNPLQYPCLENPMDRGAWLDTVYRFTKSWTRLKWLNLCAFMYIFIIF